MKRAQEHKARDLRCSSGFVALDKHLTLSGDMYLSYELHMNIVWIQKKLNGKKSRFTMLFASCCKTERKLIRSRSLMMTYLDVLLTPR